MVNKTAAHTLTILAAAAVCLLLAAATDLHAIPAFPGAEGAGSTATGGRGQTVYHVTNLNESGAGSYRDALSQSNRIIVFDVGGVCTITSASQTDQWFRCSVSNVTIAGQTAPGDGFFVRGTGMKFTGTNMVLRNVTYQPGTWPTNPTNMTMDALSLQTKDSIIDHCSTMWSGDECISISDAGKNTTIQYNLIAEPLNFNAHSYASIIGPDVSDTVISYHHNLISCYKSRAPRLGNETSAVNVADLRNNVFYNWQWHCGYNGTEQEGDGQFISNYYIAGPDSSSYKTEAFKSDSSLCGIYQSGNKIDSDRDGVFDGTDTGWTMFSGTYAKQTTPYTVSAVNTQTADAALQTVMNYSGANWWRRTTTDTRHVNNVRSAGTSGSLVNYPSDVGGFPTQQTVYRPAGYDTDQDGMPNTWETAYGLSTTVANSAGDHDSDGYTNIEEYVNDLAAFPATTTLIFGGTANSRWEQCQNWSLSWQPSRLDTVQVNLGTATVDSAGQQARLLRIAATSGSTARLQVTSGWLDVRETLSAGFVGTGSVSQSGGLVRAGTSVVIGNTAAAGTHTLSGGTLATPLLTKGNASSSFSFTGGVLHADQVAFSLTNNGGTIAPGSDDQLQKIAAASMPDINGNVETVKSLVGNTRVSGDLTLQSGSLQIDLASLTSFDTVTVDGTLSLGGTLAVVLGNGYVPAPGSQWLIGTAENITGAFSSVTSGFFAYAVGGSLYLVAAGGPEDTTPPFPDPMTFASVPAGASFNSIAMTATTATDDAGVQYFFHCTTTGGHDSGWQNSATYTDTGLSMGSSYDYQVKARDKSVNLNETDYSEVATGTTQVPESIPPTPSQMTWLTAPHAVDSTSISMTATTATDASGVEYLFTCTAGGGHSSAWQSGTTYIDMGLAEGVTYTYTVQARDKSLNQNTNTASEPANATTLALAPTPNPMTFAIAPHSMGLYSIAMTSATASDASGVEYFFQNLTDTNHFSGWQDGTAWTDANLVNGTTYAYQVKARDKSLTANETAWSEQASATTPRYDCTPSSPVDLNSDCRVDFLDFAILATQWATVLPPSVEISTNGTFDNDMTPGWARLDLPSAIGSFDAGWDMENGNPPGAGYMFCEMTLGDIDGHFLYQVVPVTPGTAYKLSCQWWGDMVTMGTPDPLAVSYSADVRVSFEDSADPATWHLTDPNIVMYKKVWGIGSLNTDPNGTWGWQPIGQSRTNAPADDIYTATSNNMVVAFSMSGPASPGAPWAEIDNFKVEGPGCPTLDFNSDCKLDWLDIQQFAGDWLGCTRSPASECWQ